MAAEEPGRLIEPGPIEPGRPNVPNGPLPIEGMRPGALGKLSLEVPTEGVPPPKVPILKVDGIPPREV